MLFLYAIGIQGYAFLLRLAALFHPKAKLWVEGRKNVFTLLGNAFENNNNDVVWVHVSSLGEFEQGRPLIEEIKKQNPRKKVLLTFFSPSGYEVRKEYPLADFVCYLPIDTQRNARKFFRIVKPSVVFFIKYDFWYHYLSEAKQQNIPTYLISALFRKEQLFFKSYGSFYRKILSFFTAIFVQDKNSKVLLNSIGYKEVVVAGDTRVDRVASLADSVKEIPYIANFKGDCSLIIAGSTWQADEGLLIHFLSRHKTQETKLIFAPHEVYDSHIRQLVSKLEAEGITCLCYSSIAEHTDLSPYKVLIIDSIGKLSALYQYGDLAYIGGGFGKGIHNILEPATFGLPVVFGEKYHKFYEAVILVADEGAFSVKNYTNLEIIVNKLLFDKNFYSSASMAAKSFISKQKGATLKVLSSCLSESY